MNKKPMQKALGPQGCSRLESISALAHQKVSQSASGRALGPALNTNLKPRARQGSANDPQSIAARVRTQFFEFLLVRMFMRMLATPS